LPILGPQVKLALGKLARDRVALDPPAAAQTTAIASCSVSWSALRFIDPSLPPAIRPA
jgi:hypothetical protein